jgi:serine phosphatase RsbU (regulator of sigma subunit)
MGTELEVAKQLQQMVLPKPEEFTHISELDIAGFMQPADEVGGDYYDVLHHKGRIKIGIGDVTGHGLESGVLMLMVQTAVRTLLANEVTNPQTFLRILNKVIYENTRRMNSKKNLTLSLLDYQDGRLSISGQHEEVLVVRKDGNVERVDTFDLGFMVGLEEDIADWVNHQEICLQPGDGVVLYTDGITEAMNSAREQYGIERLCQVITENWQHPADQIQNAVINSVRRHIGTGKAFDDITLVVLKQKPR